MKLEGKTAIVTGGGAGIGRGIVHCLAEEGADVAVVDLNRDNAGKVAGEVKASGRKSLAVEADLTDNERVKQAVRDIIAAFGKIDILVNNVGGMVRMLLARSSLEFVDMTEAEWNDSYELNLKSHILISQAVVPYFIKQKSGKIVSLSSMAGKMPGSGHMTYNVFKAADIHLTRSLATALAEHNINVNCVCPGIIYTPLWEVFAAKFTRILPEAKGMTPREYFDKFLVSRVPLKREQTVEDIGRAVVFLVSEDARNITGQALSVDGGMVMY